MPLVLCFLTRAGAAQGSGLPNELSIRGMLEASPLAPFSDELAKMDVGMKAKFYSGQSSDQSGRFEVYLHTCPHRKHYLALARTRKLGRALLLELKAQTLAHH